MSASVILIIVLAVIAVSVIFIYNSLVRSKVRTDEAWSDITVQLKRRYDLIPNLINTVSGYAKHEKEVFTKVTEARTQALSANGVAETAAADGAFQKALGGLFAVAENYPQLKANENFVHLQQELVDTEDKIQASRRFYNGSARDLNTKIQTFPTNLLAGMMGFKNREFFELDEAQTAAVAEPVKVDFNK